MYKKNKKLSGYSLVKHLYQPEFVRSEEENEWLSEPWYAQL